MNAYWRDKKVLVTGGAGFIGSNISERLVSCGARVRIVDNFERGREEYIEAIRSSAEIVRADLRDPSACSAACRDIDVVLHFASKVGGIGYYLSRPGEVIRDNCFIDMNIWKAALDARIGRFLYASSAHIYPIELQMTPDSPLIREEQDVPAHPELSYGWAKLFAEKVISYQAEEGMHTRAAIVRLIGVYGKNQDIELATGSAIPVFCRRAFEYPHKGPFVIWGTGKETRSYTFIDDAIDGMLLCVEKLDELKFVGPLNIGTEDRYTIEEIAGAAIAASGKSIAIEKDTTKKTLIWGQAVDCKKAWSFLDWRPRVGLRDGVARCYEDISRRLLS
ncbi:MAG: hypothetical protein A2583_04725 [Bdellovibrionales bacterium RIFOXYD1_FULL_53_11]|nr:MAG: hypothetical protein A2583_04725 [Bdellovibrionales bacterium RIFOXYD1_FULL_53_11]